MEKKYPKIVDGKVDCDGIDCDGCVLYNYSSECLKDHRDLQSIIDFIKYGDLTDNKIQWCFLPEEVRRKFIDTEYSGGKIEYFSCIKSEWQAKKDITWYYGNVYRLKPEEPKKEEEPGEPKKEESPSELDGYIIFRLGILDRRTECLEKMFKELEKKYGNKPNTKND